MGKPFAYDETLIQTPNFNQLLKAIKNIPNKKVSFCIKIEQIANEYFRFKTDYYGETFHKGKV